VKGRSPSEEELTALRQRVAELELSLSQRHPSDGIQQHRVEQYVTILATTSDGFWRVDGNGRLLDVNEAYCRMSGYSREELLQMSVPDLEAEESPDDTVRHVRKIMESGADRFETKHRTKEGRAIDVEVSTTYLPSAQELIAFVRDISDSRRAREALEREKLKLEKLYRASSQLAACMTEHDAYQLTVRAAEEILEFTLCSLDIVEEDRLVVKATSRELPPGASTESSLDEGLSGKTYRTGKTYVFGSLEEVPEALPTREEFKSGISSPIGDLGVFQVVSTQANAFTEDDARLLELLLRHTRETIKRLRLQQEIREQAIRDPLTSVYNRRFFNEVIQQELDRSERYAHPVAFLMIDVNRFKETNDRFGHQMGDRVLQAVADILRQSLRQSDTVIRYGGDEFLVILPETNGKAVVAVERIRAAVAERNVENPLLDFPVTLAIGVAHWHPQDPRTIESVLNEADRTMYEDKRTSC
jgi:diguanylate cyclase (GGDEF)-like protein/PAS domain S-box-containing protein